MYYITINKCILITVNKCIHIISTYFLAAARDKNMHLLTSLYGIAPTLPKRIDFTDWSWEMNFMKEKMCLHKNIMPYARLSYTFTFVFTACLLVQHGSFHPA